MKLRLIGVAAIVVALGAGAAGCGRYSISNIRSLKAFQDANNLYKKAEYKAAIESYEKSIHFNPELGFAYFFLGNSYDNLFKPAKKGDPENDANLTKAADNYRIAIQKLASSADPKEKEIRNLAFQYLIAVYGQDKLDDFSKAEPIARELIAAEPNEPTNYQALAKMYEDLGRYDEAETTFRKAIDLRPKGSSRRRSPRSSSALPPSRTTPKPGTPSAASTRTRCSATRSSRATWRWSTLSRGSRPKTRRSRSTASTSRRSPTRTSCSANRPSTRRIRRSRRRC
jgi:tetratricopeptide (TPR) repeat protein